MPSFPIQRAPALSEAYENLWDAAKVPAGDFTPDSISATAAPVYMTLNQENTLLMPLPSDARWPMIRPRSAQLPPSNT
jgi:hypothetical protein